MSEFLQNVVNFLDLYLSLFSFGVVAGFIFTILALIRKIDSAKFFKIRT